MYSRLEFPFFRGSDEDCPGAFAPGSDGFLEFSTGYQSRGRKGAGLHANLKFEIVLRFGQHALVPRRASRNVPSISEPGPDLWRSYRDEQASTVEYGICPMCAADV